LDWQAAEESGRVGERGKTGGFLFSPTLPLSNYAHAVKTAAIIKQQNRRRANKI